MADPGLNNRLRQRSRRAGIMVGLSMAGAIVLLIGAFVWIYTAVDPLTRDFVDAAAVQPTRTVSLSAPTAPAATSQDQPAPEPTATAASPQQTVDTGAPTVTATSATFAATHTVISAVAINLRPGPSVNSGDPVNQLQPGSRLQYLGETQQSSNPDVDGDLRWLRFRTESGQEGWVREIDVAPITGG